MMHADPMQKLVLREVHAGNIESDIHGVVSIATVVT
jgi:hypothetical protein